MTMAPDLDSVFDRAVSAFKAGDLDTAAESGALLLEYAPLHPAAQNLMGLVKLRQEQGEEAVDLFQRAAQNAPSDPAVLRNLGTALRKVGRTADSLAVYETAISLSPGDAGALYDLAMAQLQAGLTDRAADTFAHVLRLKPDHTSAAVRLAGLLANLGKTEEEVNILETAVTACPDDADLLMALTSSLRRAGRMPEAIARHRDVVAQHPDNARAHAALAYTLGDDRRLEEAVEVYHRSLRLGPDNAGAWSNLGWTLVELDRYREALDPCEKAVALDPTLPDARYHLALARRGVGNLEGAAEALKGALGIERRHVRALSLLGEIREELGDDDAVRRIFDPDRMIRREVLTEVPRFATVEEFNAALADAVRNHPSLTWNLPGHSTVSGGQTHDIARDGSSAMRAFRDCIEPEVRRYIEACARAAAPGEFFHDPPPNWDLTAWGVQLRAGGHQIAHTHPSGIVSGVYYPELPATIGAGPESENGFIEFRASRSVDDRSGTGAETRRVALRPERGHLLLFPSYFWHRTIPYEGPDQRISVAFDIVPR